MCWASQARVWGAVLLGVALSLSVSLLLPSGVSASPLGHDDELFRFRTSTGEYAFVVGRGQLLVLDADMALVDPSADLYYRRIYDSHSTAVGDHLLGVGWRDIFDVALSRTGPSPDPSSVTFHQLARQSQRFVRQADGSYLPDATGFGTLTRPTSSTWLIGQSATEHTYGFTANSAVDTEADRDGNQVSYRHDHIVGHEEMQLQSTFGAGASTSFRAPLEQGSFYRLAWVRDRENQMWEYTYTDDALDTVTGPSGRITQYTYDGPAGALGRVGTPTGWTIRSQYVTYAGAARVSSLEATKGTQRLSFTAQYAAPSPTFCSAAAAHMVTVTDQAGRVARFCVDSAWQVISRAGSTRTVWLDDAVRPVVDVGGELRDTAGQALTGDSYELWVDSEDAGSGVVDVQISADGQPVASRSAPCSQGGCAMELAWDFLRENFSVGPHEIGIRVSDAAGNVHEESFTVHLSPDRTPDPADEAPALGSMAFQIATPTDPAGRCRELARALGPLRPSVDSATRTLPFGGYEVTIAYDDGSYGASRCGSDGALIESERVGPIETPSGTYMVRWSRTEPADGDPESYLTHYPMFASPKDPTVAEAWRNAGAAFSRRAMRPTPGVSLAPSRGTRTQLLAGVCDTGMELNYDEHTWWRETFRYSFNTNTFPTEFRTRFLKERVIARFREGVRDWNQGRNNCHYRRLTGFETAVELDENDEHDGGDHNDGYSVIDFAPDITCDDDEPGGVTLGCTTVKRNTSVTFNTRAGVRYQATEADIRFRRNEDWHIRPRTRACQAQIDLRSMATHELGHVVGLDDSTDPGNSTQTMYKFIGRCDFSMRLLGRSDWIGLRNLYPDP
jgi:hypothetical protein